MFARKGVFSSIGRAAALATVASLALTAVEPSLALAGSARAEKGFSEAGTSPATAFSARRYYHGGGGGAAAAAFAGIVGTGLAIAATQNRRAYYDDYYGGGPVYYGGGPYYYGGGPPLFRKPPPGGTNSGKNARSFHRPPQIWRCARNSPT